ncbi:HNH endonuclease [Neotabrizicola shimadae]|uniref:HNH endonuclease n=1 Tax=Neotabrizicola shimadae TaxID=2807096 RepID=A0A8G0ZWJ3_9RHOB|nr:HNH endonuclease [Neotabrizicola shimadae]QYZ70176.1 HNH endonuclease [Neotabrizicola shimadae]
MKNCIKTPIPEIYEAAEQLSAAVDAHLVGDTGLAREQFRRADSRIVWEWTNPAWSRPDKNVLVPKPLGDSRTVPKAERVPDRSIAPHVRKAVLRRDGHRCRYCGIPVVDAAIRKIAHRHYPEVVPWNPRDNAAEHAGFQCLWLQYDHVVPHSHGGRSTADNVVICCALCNFGKDRFTLRQLGLADPRDRAPVRTDWDGLERLREAMSVRVAAQSPPGTPGRDSGSPGTPDGGALVSRFLPGAWTSAGYLFTPPVQGKERWFRLDQSISVEPVERAGVKGYRLRCDPAILRRRGIEPGLLDEA